MKTVLTEMKKAEVRFVSLVERGANRIPFRIVKNEKESHMIDLNNPRTIFKTAPKTVEAPDVVGVIVMDQDEAKMVEVVKALKDAGFSTDSAKKNEDGTVVYAQGEIPTEGTHLVRLSDEMVVVMKGFSPYCSDMSASTDFSEVMATEGFYQGISTATQALATVIRNTLYEASSGAEAAKTLNGSFAKFTTYVTALLNGIPAKAFKAELLLDAVLKSAKQPPEVKVIDDDTAEAALQAKASIDQARAGEGKELEGNETTLKTKGDEGVEGDAEKHAKGKDKVEPEEDDDKKQADADAKAKAKKTDEATDIAAIIAAALSPLTEAVATLTSTVTETATAQKSLKEQVEQIARKSDDTTKVIKSTVLAHAAGVEQPAAAEDEPVKKSEDWRTGQFDSANHRRR